MMVLIDVINNGLLKIVVVQSTRPDLSMVLAGNSKHIKIVKKMSHSNV